MPSVKCDNCGHSVEVEDSTKKYRLPLFFIFPLDFLTKRSKIQAS